MGSQAICPACRAYSGHITVSDDIINSTLSSAPGHQGIIIPADVFYIQLIIKPSGYHHYDGVMILMIMSVMT